MHISVKKMAGIFYSIFSSKIMPWFIVGGGVKS